MTGLLAAGALAGVGLYLLPLRRRRAEQQFRERTEQLRDALATALRREFEQSLNASIGRVRSVLAPYDRFVEDELARITADSEQLERLASGLAELRGRIESAGGSRQTADGRQVSAERG